ncbi:hypothetical protein F442_05991 [Phytophthora nicotianae P10297]|uniref:RAWUL domain-containing protein n=5 Tax=Phytophthora nicotianae TaxID=4792 RepID=W2ZPQ5_PHYNI|nr:hypothetical protein PPTG_02123 [Phytophthora nicotianae INRA-310]XP_008891374.1 hypothetical protein, variant [Phytophthora nicotianae INRA-310]ETI50517.1 hypothetical protein F443_05961 [Phytophthora nicotianae P1569]ETL96976.1 hypothetical protein L917_05660 [Phytophthora nicotianae]ETO79263.1 hypothetical protein F444_06004 [Phytophthora nicotianae P1976]ETP48189.1 hypothetical protein F442_06001 [Phytophthora nicotianae P10297]ETN22074.1 hypothetical protein PPTG_02123 [Phytophthora n
MLLVLMFCYGCVRGYYLDNPTSSSCPTCDMYLSAKPLTKILPDPVNKELATKLLPDYTAKEEAEERLFYRKLGVERKPLGTLIETQPSPPRTRGPSPDSMIQFGLYPQRSPDIPYFLSLGKLKAPNMLTQSHLQIRYLRKYLTKKLKVAKPDEITILCQGKVVGSEYTLEFIQRTLWKGSFKMILEYRRQRKPSMTIALANLRLLAPWLGDNFS